MYKHLYFICPTDHLETVIDNTFKQENYYYTSLGNSIAFDIATVGQVNEFMVTKKIQEISFVLSDDNHVVMDAIGKQGFSEIKGLNEFYNRIVQQKEYSNVLWHTQNDQRLILSYYLKNKIEQLRMGLKSLLVEQLNINGKIYNKKGNRFDNIYSDLIFLESFNLN